MIETILNIRNLLTFKGRSDEASLLKAGTVVKAQVVDVSEDGNALLSLLLSGSRHLQGTLIRAKSVIPLVKGQNIFLEIFDAKDDVKMRFVGDSEGPLESWPGNIPPKVRDMLIQLLTASRSGPEDRQLLNLLKSIPRSIKDAVPEFRQLEKMMAVMKQLDPAIGKAFSENADVPLETRLTAAIISSGKESILQELQSMQAEGDMKTVLQRLGRMLRDSGFVNALRQSGLKASDLESAVNALLRNISGKNEIKTQFAGDPDGMAAAAQKNVPARFLDMLAGLSNARLSNSEFSLFLNFLRALPAGIKEALPELKNLQVMWDTRQLDGKLIKAFVENSGVVFETKLTIAVLKDPGQVLQNLLALQTEGDFKSLLLKLKKLLDERDVSSELKRAGFKSTEVSRTVERFLDNIESYQLSSKLNDMLYTFLPVAWEGLNDGEFMFKKNKDARNNSYTCDINLDLESLGRLSVSITLSDRQFFVTFFTESEETEHLFHVHKHLLHERFSSQGLLLKALNLGRKKEISFGRSHLKGVNVKI
jgi:hypothetical protein